MPPVGNGSAKRARTAGARGERKLVGILAAGLDRFDGQAKSNNMDYVWAEMADDDTGDIAKSIANMLKSGTLAKATAMKTNATTTEHPAYGDVLPESCKLFRGLKNAAMRLMLTNFEELSEELSRDDLFCMLCFALGMPADARLPTHYESLCFFVPLMLYCFARYEQLGKRLQDRPAVQDLGYFQLRQIDEVSQVELCVQLRAGETKTVALHPHMTNIEEWDIVDNTVFLKAVAKHKHFGAEVPLASLFKAAEDGTYVVDAESVKWDFPDERLPDIVRQPLSTDMKKVLAAVRPLFDLGPAGAKGKGKSKAKAKAKAPAGSGRVVPAVAP